MLNVSNFKIKYLLSSGNNKRHFIIISRFNFLRFFFYGVFTNTQRLLFEIQFKILYDS